MQYNVFYIKKVKICGRMLTSDFTSFQPTDILFQPSNFFCIISKLGASLTASLHDFLPSMWRCMLMINSFCSHGPIPRFKIKTEPAQPSLQRKSAECSTGWSPWCYSWHLSSENRGSCFFCLFVLLSADSHRFNGFMVLLIVPCVWKPIIKPYYHSMKGCKPCSRLIALDYK